MQTSMPSSSAARRLAVGCGASTLCVLLTGIIVKAQDPAITTAAPAGAKSARTSTQPATQPPAIEFSAADMVPPTTVPGTAAVGGAAPLPQGPPLIELYFKDVPVVDLLDMIAKQGDVGIVIAEDVDINRVLPRISLKEKTPEDALKIVAKMAGLAVHKDDSRTYLIAKNLSTLGIEEPDTPAAPNPQPPTTLNTTAPALVAPLPELVGTTPEDEPREETKIVHRFVIRNVTPRIIAWWIDPRHNPEPPEFLASRLNLEKLTNPWKAEPALDPNLWTQMTGNGSVSSLPSKTTYNPYAPAGTLNQGASSTDTNYMNPERFLTPYTEGNAQFNQNNQNRNNRTNRTGAAGGGGGAFELPEGVDQIIAVDPQNALLVYGTEEGVRRLETIISYLDRPLRQVEIEAQFVTVTESFGSAFGIDWSGASNGPFTTNITGLAPAPASGSFTLGYLRNNFQATLRAQINANRAKTVSSPRVTAINNLTAGLFTSVSQPLLLNSTTTGFSGQVGQQQNLIYITTSVGLVVTPTINNDDTITVVMQPQVQNPNLQNVGGMTIPAPISQNISTIANVRDGETIALGGLRTKRSSRGGNRIPVLSNIPFIGQFFRENRKSDSDEDLIIFLTARILRRAEDNEAVPGT